MKLAIVIPAYNEEKRIGKTLQAYSECFEKLRKNKLLDYEILIAINGTTDNTEKIVNSFARKNKSIASINLKEGDKGNAVIQGIKFFLKRKNDLIGFVDADMSTPPEEFARLAKKHDEEIKQEVIAERKRKWQRQKI